MSLVYNLAGMVKAPVQKTSNMMVGIETYTEVFIEISGSQYKESVVCVGIGDVGDKVFEKLRTGMAVTITGQKWNGEPMFFTQVKTELPTISIINFSIVFDPAGA